MTKLSKDVKKYFKDVKKKMSCSWIKKKAYIDFIKCHLDPEVLYNENTSYNDLIAIIGEPEKVAANFNSADKTEIELRSKILSITFLIIIILIIIVIILLFTIISLIENLGGYVITAD